MCVCVCIYIYIFGNMLCEDANFQVKFCQASVITFLLLWSSFSKRKLQFIEGAFHSWSAEYLCKTNPCTKSLHGKELIIVPIHKKGDKTDCNNYGGISLLPTTYKILSNMLLSRLIPNAKEIIGDLQCGFRRNRSTIDHIFCIRQIVEEKMGIQWRLQESLWFS